MFICIRWPVIAGNEYQTSVEECMRNITHISRQRPRWSGTNIDLLTPHTLDASHSPLSFDLVRTTQNVRFRILPTRRSLWYWPAIPGTLAYTEYCTPLLTAIRKKCTWRTMVLSSTMWRHSFIYWCLSKVHLINVFHEIYIYTFHEMQYAFCDIWHGVQCLILSHAHFGTIVCARCFCLLLLARARAVHTQLINLFSIFQSFFSSTTNAVRQRRLISAHCLLFWTRLKLLPSRLGPYTCEYTQ